MWENRAAKVVKEDDVEPHYSHYSHYPSHYCHFSGTISSLTLNDTLHIDTFHLNYISIKIFLVSVTSADDFLNTLVLKYSLIICNLNRISVLKPPLKCTRTAANKH